MSVLPTTLRLVTLMYRSPFLEERKYLRIDRSLLKKSKIGGRKEDGRTRPEGGPPL